MSPKPVGSSLDSRLLTLDYGLPVSKSITQHPRTYSPGMGNKGCQEPFLSEIKVPDTFLTMGTSFQPLHSKNPIWHFASGIPLNRDQKPSSNLATYRINPFGRQQPLCLV